MGERPAAPQRPAGTAEAAVAMEGPVPTPLVERALARLGDAGDLLHDVLDPGDRGADPVALPGDLRRMLGVALEALARAERLPCVGLGRAGPG